MQRKKAEKVIENIGKASKQDKVAGMKVLEDVAKKNGFEKFHTLKNDFDLPDPKKWDAFFTKEDELYF